MGEAKPWQIAVVVAGLLVLAGSLVWHFVRSDRVKIGDSVTLVDVSSGQLVKTSIPTKFSMVFPATNPDTKKDTLLPAHKDDASGKWFIKQRYLTYLKDMKSEQGGITDPKTGEIKTSGETVSRDVFK